MAETYSAGIVTAYGAAVRGGYTGTYEQWCQDMANLGDNVAEVRTKAAQAAQSAGNAAGSATAAAESATAAASSATAASASATAAGNAQAAAAESATAAASSATAASASATAAGNAQAAAETAQGKAEDAQEAAEQAQSDAEAAAQSVSQSAAQIETNRISKAPVIIDSASGTIASFPDGADGLPLHKLTVRIEPVQAGSGDPSPDNVRPISGWTGANVTRMGVNVWNEEWELGYIDADTGESSSSPSSLYIISKNFIAVSPSTSYFFFCNKIKPTPWNNIPIYCYDVNKAYLGISTRLAVNNAVFTTPANCRFIKFRTGAEYGTTYLNDISVNCPSTDTEYHAYSGQHITITFPNSAGTVYGGTLTINDDGTGELRTRPEIASYNGETLIGPWVSSMDVYSPGLSPTIGAQVVDLGGAETVYQLSNEQVINTLYGTNNIWADCGDIELEYRAGTKLYIQKINAPADDDMTADAQITSGKYFIVGNNLYLSTTTIPAGDTIIPGTNCTKTNLAEALNALNV